MNTATETPKRYIVETLTICEGWVNCWITQQDGVDHPTWFETPEQAEDEIRDYLTDCINAVEGGDMEDCPDPSHLRVVEWVER